MSWTRIHEDEYTLWYADMDAIHHDPPTYFGLIIWETSGVPDPPDNEYEAAVIVTTPIPDPEVPLDERILMVLENELGYPVWEERSNSLRDIYEDATAAVKQLRREM